jgi:hypothetical protein
MRTQKCIFQTSEIDLESLYLFVLIHGEPTMLIHLLSHSYKLTHYVIKHETILISYYTSYYCCMFSEYGFAALSANSCSLASILSKWVPQMVVSDIKPRTRV